ncbi:MAG: winged helix-turn-helix transcriptional regulator [Candidatus Omnitrophica bacterium]|nr:winged helix-turn-helix transcriptional regulator [Candidatus Omnitrophota bacterium]
MIENLQLYQKIIVGFSKLSQAMKNKSWERGSQRKISPTQGQILAFLAGRKKDAITSLSDIVDHLGVTAATVSDAVRILTEKGLIKKTVGLDDKRLINHTLTLKGLKLAQEVSEWPDFMNQALDVLPADDHERLFLILIKMIRQLQVRGEIPVSRMCATCQYFRLNMYSDNQRPHHCAFVNEPFGNRNLRLDCPDHQEADAQLLDKNWNELINKK